MCWDFLQSILSSSTVQVKNCVHKNFSRADHETDPFLLSERCTQIICKFRGPFISCAGKCMKWQSSSTLNKVLLSETLNSAAAHLLRAARHFNLKNVKHNSPRRFLAIPWELMLPGMFVLEYKSRCQFQCACQRSKTSTQPDRDDGKHTDIAWVNGGVGRGWGASLEHWLEKLVCLCIRVASCVPADWLQCVYVRRCEYTHTSQGGVSVCKYELSLINKEKQREA